MKKINFTILIIATFGQFNLFSQNDGLNYTIELTPAYAIPKLSNGNNAVGEALPIFAFEGRAMISKEIFDWLEVRTGLGYMNCGEKTGWISLVNGPQHDPADPTEVFFRYKQHFIELPVGGRFKIGQRVFSDLTILNMLNVNNTYDEVYRFLDQSKERERNEDNSTDFRKYNLGIELGFGVNILNKESVSIYVEPNIAYTLFGASRTAAVNRNYFIPGLRLGLTYHK